MDNNINGDSNSCKNEPPYLFIKDITDLSGACEILAKAKVMGVDLESDSMFHYREKVCLIQISVPDLNILIDTLSIRDLAPLSPILSNPDIRKVFHGADYDIRSLSRDFSIEVNSLFDTQIAAKFLGMTQTGLSAILESRFGIRLEKKFQKSDWSRRPLSSDMLRYAVQDTCHLIPLSCMFEDELIGKGRLAWFEEECELLSRVRFSPPRQDPLYTRFKGASKLSPRDLAIIDEILKWREDLSRKKDIPPFKIISNQQVLEVAGKKPAELDGLGMLSKKQIAGIGKSILNCVQSAMAIPEEMLPVFPREKRQKLGTTTLKRISALKEWRDRFGKETGLDPSVISPNALIEAIAVMNPRSRDGLKELSEMRRWQIELFGNDICDLLASTSITEK